MAPYEPKKIDRSKWAPETQLVHGGMLRSGFGETSEAIFLTQGYVYNTAEQAEARFKNEDPGFQYSRFRNPTVSMFEERMRFCEGAEEARATATGMAAVTAAVLSYLKSRRSCRRRARHVRLLPQHHRDLCPRFGITSTLIDGRDLDAWRKAVRPNTKAFFFETPSNPTLDLVDIAAVSKIAKENGAMVRRRQRIRHTDAAASARARRRRRRLLRNQAHRWPGPLPRRRRACSSNSSQDICRIACARPARRSAHSTPGCCSRAWRRCRFASRPNATTRGQASPITSPAGKGVKRVLYCGRPDHPQADTCQGAK